MIMVFGTNGKFEKERELVRAFAQRTFDFDVKAKAVFSNKHNLKGFEIYELGKNSLKAYVDLMKNEVTFYNRKKVVKVESLEG